jgi:hypothetical protein
MPLRDGLTAAGSWSCQPVDELGAALDTTHLHRAELFNHDVRPQALATAGGMLRLGAGYEFLADVRGELLDALNIRQAGRSATALVES